ncbi:MAG: D-2-hydroxyacid dehydrogenase [Christensenellales bacterium]
MDINSVWVVMPATAEHLAALQEAAPGARIIRRRPGELEAGDLAEADIIVGNPPIAMLPQLKRARLIQLNTAGVAVPYLALEHSAPDTVLCCASGAYGPAISEHMMALLLGLMKRLHQYRDDQHQTLWQDRGQVRCLRGAKVLMLGLGDIGSHFASLCAAFGAEVVGVRRRGGEPPQGVSRVATLDHLDSLLPWADVVALALPETAGTRGLLNRRTIALMKPGAFVLNVGRGSAIDQAALAEALHAGHLAGAGLDVTDPEPLPAADPLWQAPNLLLTPHISGLYHLKVTHDLVIDIACRNIRALPDGPFVSRVDYASGYRA